MIQPELPFGTEPHKLVRRDDPSTSYEAAVKIDTTSLERLVFDVIKKHGSFGCISDDVRAELSYLAYSSVTARYKALSEKNLIIFTGEKRKGESGRSQRVMRANK